MVYTLVIVESPAKCKKIESYLGTAYKCIASYGHIQEREAIAWHICQVFNLPLTTKRIIFHEITKGAIERAVQNPGTLNMDMVHAQQARQVLDLLVGYKISPILWQHISRNSKTGLSAGRCQTPALRLVYDNQQDIEASPGKKVYNTTGYFTKLNLGFALNHSFEIIGFNTAVNTMENFLEDSVEHNHLYSCSKPKQTTKNPPTPFTTSSLQQKASSELNISPKETMSICQKLYEAGYITYMRTDSSTYCLEFIQKASDYIKDKFGDKYLHDDVNRLSERKVEKTKKTKKSKKDDKENSAQEAHEAIRPTDVKMEKVEDSY